MADRHDPQHTAKRSDAEDLLLTDPQAIADREARNGLLQFDEVEKLIALHAQDQALHFEPALLRHLNRLAIEGIRKSAGYFRLTEISITNTSHQPPPAEDVEHYVREMCGYVNEHWSSREGDLENAIHLSAYLMWRLNWIHPFRDGNGRTSRALSYLALGVRLGRQLAGEPTIADQIVDNKGPYYDALDAADEAYRVGHIDVALMETLITDLLVVQLSSVAS